MAQSESEFHIVGICGSLRKNSCNRGLLRAFEQELPESITFTLADISGIPFYNEDKELPYPESVVKLKELVNSAHALVISSPEYNLSYTAVLKNSIEWLSRRGLQTQLAGKPVALMGASGIGSSLSQSHLRDIMFALNMRVITRPIVHVGHTREKFDQEGHLTDAPTKQLIVQLKDAVINAL